MRSAARRHPVRLDPSSTWLRGGGGATTQKAVCNLPVWMGEVRRGEPRPAASPSDLPLKGAGGGGSADGEKRLVSEASERAKEQPSSVKTPGGKGGDGVPFADFWEAGVSDLSPGKPTPAARGMPGNSLPPPRERVAPSRRKQA